MQAQIQNYQESVVRFGPQDGLVGVRTTPVERTRPETPTFVLFNAGIVHRVGPFRMNVEVARSLASSGFSSFRFDLSGLGESGFRRGNLSAEERALLDAEDAFQVLEKQFDSRTFVTLGLCSGAFNAFQVAVSDPRVVGVVSIDGVAFETRGFRRREITRKMNWRFLRNALKRRAMGGKKMDAVDPADELAQKEFFDVGNDPRRVKKQLMEVIDRGVELKFVYTGGSEDFNSEKQFEEMFGIKTNETLQVDYLADSEHTFPICDHRNKLIDMINEWAQSRF